MIMMFKLEPNRYMDLRIVVLTFSMIRNCRSSFHSLGVISVNTFHTLPGKENELRSNYLISHEIHERWRYSAIMTDITSGAYLSCPHTCLLCGCPSPLHLLFRCLHE